MIVVSAVSVPFAEVLRRVGRVSSCDGRHVAG